jgi:hypothetical protein
MKGMSVVLLSVVVLALAVPASAGDHGWGLAAGSFDGDFGVQARKGIWLGGDVSQIVGQVSATFKNKTTFRLDADYHFTISSGGGRFYPLAGLQFAFNSDTAKFGINGGGGINFKLTESLAAFGEGKYVFGDWDGWFFVGGIYF